LRSVWFSSGGLRTQRDAARRQKADRPKGERGSQERQPGESPFTGVELHPWDYIHETPVSQMYLFIFSECVQKSYFMVRFY